MDTLFQHGKRARACVQRLRPKKLVHGDLRTTPAPAWRSQLQDTEVNIFSIFLFSNNVSSKFFVFFVKLSAFRG